MAVIINDRYNISGFGFRMVENDVHYSNIAYILKYIKEGVFPFMFRNGIQDFKEVLTNYSEPELRGYFFPKKDGSLPENERKYTSKGLTAYIHAIQNFDMNGRKGMQNLPVHSTAYDPLEYQRFILMDNLLTMSYSTDVYSYNADIAIHTGTGLEIHEMVNFLYSRVHVGKKFYLMDQIRIPHIIDEEVIKLLRLIYKEETDEEFDMRLTRITGGRISRSIDGTTGNMVTFVDIHTNPIVTVSNISTNEDGATVSIELELSLPSRIWLSSVYTLEELINNVVEEIVIGDLTGIPKDIIDKILNFDPDTLYEYWWVLTILTKDTIHVLEQIDIERLKNYYQCLTECEGEFLECSEKCSIHLTTEEYDLIKDIHPDVIGEYLKVFEDEINSTTVDDMWDILKDYDYKIIDKIRDGVIIPIVDIEKLPPEYFGFIGSGHPGFPRLEKIILSVNAHDSVGSMPVHTITKAPPEEIFEHKTYDKVTTFMANYMFETEPINEIEITDAVFKEVVFEKDGGNYKMVVKKNNTELFESTDYVVKRGNYSLYIHTVQPANGGIFMVELFKRKEEKK